MKIRPISLDDYDAVWAILSPIIERGDTYAIPTEISREEALEYWVTKSKACYCVDLDGQIAGTYYLKVNQMGPADHVCSCGYMVPETMRSRGLASSMCEHSQREAIRLGFKAMQFNLVVSTNKGAIKLWERLGFGVVGKLPKAFNHPTEGLVDAFVMYKWLET